MKPTLLILAAGMASRYGSMKQTEGFGPTGETIMEYSIFDAIRAGFGKVVFIIRSEFYENFKNAFDIKLKGKIETDYVFQEMDRFVTGIKVPENRTKPWGTGHAVLCAVDAISGPFAVINADDYYGPEAFVKAADFLNSQCNAQTYAIIGYQLDKTLSTFGTVSRGVCKVDEQMNLLAINERTSIYKEDNRVIYEENGKKIEVPGNSSVSMNFWCFHPSIFERSKSQFETFIKANAENVKSEFFIPLVANAFIKEKGNTIKVIPTRAQWFGVTYKEDAPTVKKDINQLVSEGVYPSSLWG